MAKLFNSVTEGIALRAMCSRDPKIAGKFIGSLDETYFYNEESVETYNRIRALFEKKGEPPSFRLLCEDIGLSESSREFIRNVESAPRTTAQAEQVLHQLDTYRKTRLVYSMATGLLKRLEKPRVNMEEIVELITKRMTRIQTSRTTEADIVRIGKDSNVLEHIERILYEEENDQCIPTGFKTFDAVNGGFFRGSLVTIGGSSGGGKSILCNQLNLNQSSMGYKTNLTPLEMTTPEMLSRSMASVTGFNSIDIFLKRLADGERDAIYRKMRRFDKKVAAANGQYTIFKPKEDMSIEELLAAVHSLNGDVTYIDYIGLLKGADGDDQWRKLGQIARYGKIYAEIHNKVVVLLAQVSDDGKLRYSQAIKEHSSLAWTFVATKETKEKGYMNIELLKSRNQNPQPFTLKCDYSKMHVSDLDPSELKELEKAANAKDTDRRSKGKFKASESGDESDYVPDLTE